MKNLAANLQEISGMDNGKYKIDLKYSISIEYINYPSLGSILSSHN
jgi:hypothetical protein